MKPSKVMIADAAIAGLLSGAIVRRACPSRAQNKAGKSVRTLADDGLGRHRCNSCDAKKGGVTAHAS